MIVRSIGFAIRHVCRRNRFGRAGAVVLGGAGRPECFGALVMAHRGTRSGRDAQRRGERGELRTDRKAPPVAGRATPP